MKSWKDVTQEKQVQKNSLKTDRAADNIVDIYKKEILNTRIVVSNLMRDSRVAGVVSVKDASERE